MACSNTSVVVLVVLVLHGLIDCHPKAQSPKAPDSNAPIYFPTEEPVMFSAQVTADEAPMPTDLAGVSETDGESTEPSDIDGESTEPTIDFDNRFGFLGHRLGRPRPPLFHRPQEQFVFQGQGPSQSQFNPGQSVSGVNSEAYNKQVEIGDLELSKSRTDVNTFTQTENGFNGGRTQSVSKGVKHGDVDISSTFTKQQEINNGRLSGKLSHNLDIGDVELESSLSRENLRKGVGLVRDQNGEVSLNLGPLNFELTKGQRNPSRGTGTTANVNAAGIGAQTQSNSQNYVDKQNYGLVDVTNTHSISNAIGSVENGYTNANGDAFANRAISSRNSLFRPDFGFFGRHKREIRPKRQFQFPGQFGRPGFGGQQGRPGFGGQPNFGFNQNSAANSGSNQVQNEFGNFQQNTGNAISSNLANDGSSGQLSSSNTAQQSYQTADGSGNQNSAQGQSTNFGPNGQLQLSNAQSNNIYTMGPNGERQENNAGANSLNQNQFGSQNNIANAGTIQYNENGVKGERTNADAQSTNTNEFGTSGATSNTKTETITGPDGKMYTSSSSSASSNSVNNGKGGNVSSNANAASGNVNGQSFGNAAGSTNIYQQQQQPFGFNNYPGFGNQNFGRRQPGFRG